MDQNLNNMKIGKYIEDLYGIQTNINLSELKKYSNVMYGAIKENFQKDKHDYTGQSTLTTELFQKYNLMMYPFPIFHELYFTISKAFHLCHKDLMNEKAEHHYMQCWLNFYKKGDFIDWHTHQTPELRAWHGFICVDTEPGSYTSYKWDPKVYPSRKDIILDVQSKDGLIVLGPSKGDVHRSSEWEFDDRPRITIAFDILPAESVSVKGAISRVSEPKYSNAMKASPYFVNHWIPV